MVLEHNLAVNIMLMMFCIVRLPRHGASCPVAMAVSCSADRNVKQKINKDGIWLENWKIIWEIHPESMRQAGEGKSC